MEMFEYVGDFCAKPRMTQRDKWKMRPIVVRYYAFKDAINLAANEVGFKLGDRFAVQFDVAMPKSWSKVRKKAMCGEPHRSRPDLDNFVKAVMDCLKNEDSTVYNIRAVKYWAYESKIILHNF